MEIRIRRRTLTAALILGLIFLSLITAALIGAIVTPYDANGEPVLLRPEIIIAEGYRGRSVGWVDGLRELHGDLYALLSSGGHDLYRDSDAANRAYSRARAIAEAIEVAPPPPPAMGGVWEQARLAAGAYLEAAQLAAIWVGTPTEAVHGETITALSTAERALNDLEGSPWLRHRWTN